MLRIALFTVVMLCAAILQGCATIGKAVITPAKAEEMPSRAEPRAAPAARPPTSKAVPEAPPQATPAPPIPAAAPHYERSATPSRAPASASGSTETGAAEGAAATQGAGPGATVGAGAFRRAEAVEKNPAVKRKAHAPSVEEMGFKKMELARAAGAVATGSSELSVDADRMRRRDEYIKHLQEGGYSFSPPSPIKVDERIPVGFWIDPMKKGAQLAEEMKKVYPESAARVEGGQMRWSPTMRATLTGVGFEITPVEGKEFDGVKDLSMIGRTEWGWTIVPKVPGKKQRLHLVVEAMMPPDLGKPWEKVLDHEVDVEVTWWWLIDHFWEKYWKPILWGLGGALAAAIAWWWKKRFGGGSR